MAPKQVAKARFGVGATIVQLLHHQAAAGGAAAAQHAELDLVGVDAALIAVEVGQDVGALRLLPAQPARRRTGLEAELGYGVANPAAGLRADMAFVIDDARDRLDRHAGQLRHIDDR